MQLILDFYNAPERKKTHGAETMVMLYKTRIVFCLPKGDNKRTSYAMNYDNVQELVAFSDACFIWVWRKYFLQHLFGVKMQLWNACLQFQCIICPLCLSFAPLNSLHLTTIRLAIRERMCLCTCVHCVSAFIKWVVTHVCGVLIQTHVSQSKYCFVNLVFIIYRSCIITSSSDGRNERRVSKYFQCENSQIYIRMLFGTGYCFVKVRSCCYRMHSHTFRPLKF